MGFTRKPGGEEREGDEWELRRWRGLLGSWEGKAIKRELSKPIENMLDSRGKEKKGCWEKSPFINLFSFPFSLFTYERINTWVLNYFLIHFYMYIMSYLSVYSLFSYLYLISNSNNSTCNLTHRTNITTEYRITSNYTPKKSIKKSIPPNTHF